ncbi:MAG: hypothetical protein ACJASM_000015 [Salibacteraceae bacterium]|jgi:hypothetical protein
MKHPLIVLALLVATFNLTAQDDLLDMLEAEESTKNYKVGPTWKTMKLVNLHSTSMVKKNGLDFRVTHRFGSIGEKSGGGVHNLYGLDISDDIRISFDYGITENLQIGIGRSKYSELIDASIKYKVLAQKERKAPLTIVVLGNIATTPQQAADARYDDWLNTLSYFSQVIIARKLGDRLSFEFAPSLLYRNLVLKTTDIDGFTAKDENVNISLGFGGRFMITKRVGIIVDYMYTFSEYRSNYRPINYYDPFGVGVEIETGGHVFHITMTNAAGIVENNYIPNTTANWGDGGIKLGFNISRVFQF